MNRNHFNEEELAQFFLEESEKFFLQTSTFQGLGWPEIDRAKVHFLGGAVVRRYRVVLQKPRFFLFGTVRIGYDGKPEACAVDCLEYEGREYESRQRLPQPLAWSRS